MEAKMFSPKRSCRVLHGNIVAVMGCKDSGGVGYLNQPDVMVLYVRLPGGQIVLVTTK